MKKSVINNIKKNKNIKNEDDDTGISAAISGSAQTESLLESTNITKQQKTIKNKTKTIIEKKDITKETNTIETPPPKENVEIFVKSLEITNIISSMLSSSPHFEKYSKEDKDTSEMLKKYTDIKQISNDPNQTVNSKNNSPFYMLDNKDDKSKSQQQKTKEAQKSKDVSSMTKNHLENILTNNKKQNSYMSAQNNNNSFRYKPYDNNSNNNNNNHNNNKFSRSNEDNESKSSSINRNSKINKNNSQQPKKGMWD
ncbi:hypothetical protein ACTFIU_008332 [Dictyostelium citrinum]